MKTAPPVVLSIAGLDPSSGAGITADLATFAAFGLYGVSVPTVLTVQSTTGVHGASAVDAEYVAEALLCLADDLPLAGIKLGALGSREVAGAAADFLARMRRETSSARARVPVVFDPVLVSTSGRALFPADAVDVLHGRVLPCVDWLTPNWQELALLSGRPVTTTHEAESAAMTLGHRHRHLTIVVTGGDQAAATDLLRMPDGGITCLPGDHIPSSSTHGTGCAFSSALLATLVGGASAVDAVLQAKGFVAEGIRRAPKLGRGHGPLHLLWPLQPGRPSA